MNDLPCPVRFVKLHVLDKKAILACVMLHGFVEPFQVLPSSDGCFYVVLEVADPDVWIIVEMEAG